MNCWLLSLACLSLFFPCALEAGNQTKIFENSSGSTLPFRLTSGYLIEVEGRIGDQDHLKFILDTGASISIVRQRIAQTVKVDAHPAKSFNFDRNLQWETATLPDIQFGPIRAANVAVLVGDLTRYSDFAGNADAIIGTDLLNLSNLTIDFATRTLTFDLSERRAYLAGNDPMAKCLIVELKVQDRPVHLIVDSGFQGMLLYEERLRKSVPGLRTAGSTRNAKMGGRMQVKQAILPDVLFGKRNRDVQVTLLPSPAAGTLPEIDGVVGIAALQARRVYFNFSKRTLTWE